MCAGLGRLVYIDSYEDTEPQHEDAGPWYNNPALGIRDAGATAASQEEQQGTRQGQEHNHRPDISNARLPWGPLANDWGGQASSYRYDDEDPQGPEDKDSDVKEARDQHDEQPAERAKPQADGTRKRPSVSPYDTDSARPVAYGRKGLRDAFEDQTASIMKDDTYDAFYDSCECPPHAGSCALQLRLL